MNSLKHAFPNGEGQITVTYESTKASWKLSIGDDGIGLRATAARGEGLGTSIVESLANQLNADVDRTSTVRGTVVSISYPRAVPITDKEISFKGVIPTVL